MSVAQADMGTFLQWGLKTLEKRKSASPLIGRATFGRATRATPRFCSVAGCSRKHYARTVCRFHYHKNETRLDTLPAVMPDPPHGQKLCSGCGKFKPLDEFHTRKEVRRHKYQKCKVCCAEYKLFLGYGLTRTDYETLLKAQGNKCAICGIDEATYRAKHNKPLAVDHCHESKVVRGIVCSKCNVGLGQYDDNHAKLRLAAEYLERHLAKRN
jgi:hypothetical protein